MAQAKAAKRKKSKSTPRWYFDASALGYTKIWREVMSKSNIAVISHLAIGEFFGFGLSDKRDEIERGVVLEQIEHLSSVARKKDYVEIVGNSKIKTVFTDVINSTELKIPDAIHLATAIYHNCDILRSGDSDLSGLTKKKIKQLADKHGCSLSITKVG